MLWLDKLPADTRNLLDVLAGDKRLGQFFLIGGTALTLFWGHRQSEDLDFVTPQINLPTQDCEGLIEEIKSQNWRVEEFKDPKAQLQAAKEGFDLEESKRDFICTPRGGMPVKLTFFADDCRDTLPCYTSPLADLAHQYGEVKVLPPEVIFRLKSQLLLRRTSTRDLFDMMTFLDKGWSVESMVDEMKKGNVLVDHETVRLRLLEWKIPPTDPGVARLIHGNCADLFPDESASLADIRKRLKEHFDAYEARIAQAILSERRDDPKGYTP
jgi:hypothetical protein